MAVQQSEIPQRIVLIVVVPQRLSTKSVNLTVSMFDSRLRFLLGQRLRAQAHERAVARCAAQGNAKAIALLAAARDAEAQEAQAVADCEKRCATA
jgi:hypothetical protein